MSIDERLLALLVCPNCHGDLEHLRAKDAIKCLGDCGYTYPVRDGIPVMLVDEAQKP